MKISELLGASLTAAIVGGLLIGFLAARDFGVAAIFFSTVAFGIAFLAAVILSYPLLLAGKLLSRRTVLPIVAIVGGVAAGVIFAVLAKASWLDVAKNREMILLYVAVGMMCAISALAYIERSRIVRELRRLFE